MFLQFLINNVYNFYFLVVLNDFSLHIFCIYFMLTYFGFIFFPYKFFVWNDKGEWGEHDGHVGECALAFRKLTLERHCRCQCSGDCADCIGGAGGNDGVCLINRCYPGASGMHRKGKVIYVPNRSPAAILARAR